MSLPDALPPPEPDLEDPGLYLNRELSLLEFNRRVLAQAQDERVPLLERLRFLTICGSNLDEFFEVRVAGLRQHVAFQMGARGPDGLTPREILARVATSAHALVEEQYRVLEEDLLPALRREGVRLLDRSFWTQAQRRWIRRLFVQDVFPVLTPVGLDPAHPFPRVLNKGLSFLIALQGRDAFGRPSGTAVLQVPRALPRLIRLPPSIAGAPHDIVPLSAVIHAHVGDLFPGMRVTGCHAFRITRDSELWVDEEDVDNLLLALQGELSTRHYGEAVRLELGDACPEELANLLLRKAGLEPEDLFRVRGPVNLNRLSALYGLVDRPDLKYPPFEPGVPARLKAPADLFDAIRRGDLLLHHPFESFGPVLEFLRQAAADPQVVAITQPLYRTGPDSPVTAALDDAARAGKEVTAVVELRARFDEAANIDQATSLQRAGANVVYGIVGHKAHAKMLLVLRREGGRLRRYVHLGTGNYHPANARAYTDVSLLSSRVALAEDVHRIFLQLTGLGRAARLERLLQAPFTLESGLHALIEAEIREASAGRPARITAKLNALTDPGMVRALYRASRAGVVVDLVVRGICVLKPGLPGVSERIRVRSIVGRFLEHERVWRFHAGGRDRVFASSADWMERNLRQRVETCFPVEDEALARRLAHECLDLYLDDDAQAWILGPDGAWRRAEPAGPAPRSAQQRLLETLAR
jgi:polyphosphate kinase